MKYAPFIAQWVIVAILAAWLAGCGSGGGGDENAATATTTENAATSNSLTISPRSILFADRGDSKQLQATFVRSDGTSTPTTAQWSSSKPDIVTVDASGKVTAVAAVGSAQIVAEANGVKSPPTTIVIATPVSGAVLIEDSQVAEGPFPVNPEAEYDIGYRGSVILKGNTAYPTGTVLIGTGEIPLAGKVVESKVENNQTQIIIETIPLMQLFRELDIDEGFRLADADAVIPREIADSYTITTDPDGDLVFTSKEAAANTPKLLSNTTISDTPAPPLEPNQFRLGDTGFVCTATAGISIDLLKAAFKMVPKFRNDVKVKGTTTALTRLDISIKGPIAIDGTLEFASGADLEATADCKMELASFPSVPLPGAFAQVAIGSKPVIGFEFKLSNSSGKDTFSVPFKYKQTLNSGMQCPPFAADFTTEPSLPSCQTYVKNGEPDITAGEIKIVLPSAPQARVEPRVFAYGGVILSLDNPWLKRAAQKIKGVLGGKLSLEFMTVRGGAGVNGSFATSSTQLADLSYASSYEVTSEFGVKLAAKLTVLRFLSLSSSVVNATVPKIVLFGSPKATAITADRATLQPDVPVTVTIALDTSTIAIPVYEIPVIKSVSLYRRDAPATPLATVQGEPRRTQYQMTFTPTSAGPIQDNLFAYVDTSVVNSNVVSLPLELGSAVPGTDSSPISGTDCRNLGYNGYEFGVEVLQNTPCRLPGLIGSPTAVPTGVAIQPNLGVGTITIVNGAFWFTPNPGVTTAGELCLVDFRVTNPADVNYSPLLDYSQYYRISIVPTPTANVTRSAP
ncbi:Ig-like domain (group 2) [Noviherbaspirillum humi]|uniref:Ig-like domain (Group 2) n=1 Tax=Noviherbaspirillum humi TaxID=1688639 RepID=A0A239LFZ8_9BURK|nr:Ig-like domain-containing protein [Noviherbaspirillum humi]SNT28569.1 Ig-like domain (group 2) [Noviherbaspirillum humi]